MMIIVIASKNGFDFGDFKIMQKLRNKKNKKTRYIAYKIYTYHSYKHTSKNLYQTFILSAKTIYTKIILLPLC